MHPIVRRFATRTALPAVLALVTAARTLGAQAAPAPGGPFVEAIGAAQVRVPPDRATITLSVESKGVSAAAVAASNARTQRAVLDTLAGLGLRGSTVSTQSFNVSPNYESDAQGRRQVGYVARNAVTVRLTDLTRIGAVIDAALARGATGVGNLDFASSAADSASRAATRQAIVRAHAQAEAMADALGGTLGPLISVTSSPEDARGFIAMRGVTGGTFSSATAISPTDVVVSAGVLGRWQFVGR